MIRTRLLEQIKEQFGKNPYRFMNRKFQKTL